MAKPEVLDSLRELRDLETRRLEDEREARRQEAAGRAAAEAARVAAEETARLVRRRQLEEDAIRVREAEARARAEALVRIEAARLACEIELRRAELAVRRPRWLIGVAAGLAVITIGLGWLVVAARDGLRRQTAAAAAAQQRADDAVDQLSASESAGRALERQIIQARHDLQVARAEAAAARAGAPRPAPAIKKPVKPQPQPQPPDVIEVCTDGVLCD